MGRAGVAPPESWLTARVLQAEAGLVSLGHFASSDGVEEVVVAERLHAVVVSVGVEPVTSEKRSEVLRFCPLPTLTLELALSGK